MSRGGAVLLADGRQAVRRRLQFRKPVPELRLFVPKISSTCSSLDEQAELRVGPNGWCFLGSLSEDKRNDFVARIVTDPRLSDIVSVCVKNNLNI